MNDKHSVFGIAIVVSLVFAIAIIALALGTAFIRSLMIIVAVTTTFATTVVTVLKNVVVAVALPP